MSKSFKTNLDPANKTFVELKSGKYPWWDNLKKNKNISIQVRKENTVDVYYNGGAILKDLQYNDAEKFTASIHPKYIPLKDESQYKALTLSSNGVEFTGKIDVMEFSQLEDTKIKGVMNRVKKYFDSESEKAIQYQFAANDQYIIDTEFQVKNLGLRIDLVRLDESVKKIVLIEVKTMGDSRLFAESGDRKENIHDQLKKYHEFAVDYQKSILDYYVKVLQIKNDLGLTGSDIKKLTINDWQVECKPLLVFGDCEQVWINQNAANIDKKIKGVAYGAYYFGEPKYSLNLLKKTKKNQHIF
jgi:hypothetical protein